MFYRLVVLFILHISLMPLCGANRNIVVADSSSHAPLSNASVFDRNGTMIGISSSKGRMPYISSSQYPITVRYLGYKETSFSSPDADTIFLSQFISDLPEIVVESRQHSLLHMLAYVREYSTLTTYTDTIFLFREKMVDYMMVPDKKVHFKGWNIPRILSSKSYYKFTNATGLDSVSDTSNHHFSWSDWIGLPSAQIPHSLYSINCGNDTIWGKYSPSEIWSRADGRLSVDINILADSSGRKWVKDLTGFFNTNLDFDKFSLRYNYDNVINDNISPFEMTGYSFNIESTGRGHDMFRFHKKNEPFFVSTYGEVYIMDKEFITVKEAKKWQNHHFKPNEIGIYASPAAPSLQPSILSLISRIDNIDKDGVRLTFKPDSRIGHSPLNKNYRFGNRILNAIKDFTGITLIKTHKKEKKNWREFKEERRRENKKLYEEEDNE